MIKHKDLEYEDKIHEICEKNLEEFFQVRFLAHKYRFADEYSGEMDTLGIDYDGNPVIIEYKLNKTCGVLSQVLFYLDWLVNHKGDFKSIAEEKIGKDIKIKWDNPKMIVVARDFDRYDKYAVNQINYDIYLYKYLYYENNELLLENINTADNRKYVSNKRNPNRIKSGNKDYTKLCYDDHLEKGGEKVQKLVNKLNEQILNLSDQVEIRCAKSYIAYRTTRNFVEVHVQKSDVIIYVLAIDYDDPKKKIEVMPESYQWALNRRVRIVDDKDLNYVFRFIQKSFESTI